MNTKLTQEKITQISNFLQHDIIPQQFTLAQKNRLKKLSNNYQLIEEKLFFFDLLSNITKKVISQEEKDVLLQKLFEDPATTGTSRDHFFQRVYATYHGISRRQVDAFLKKQPSYQAHRRVRKAPVIKPIITKRPNAHWQMDLIQMDDEKMVHANNGFCFSLNVVDLFFKFAWAVPQSILFHTP